jgi:hypothetical protein
MGEGGQGKRASRQAKGAKRPRMGDEKLREIVDGSHNMADSKLTRMEEVGAQSTHPLNVPRCCFARQAMPSRCHRYLHVPAMFIPLSWDFWSIKGS